MRIRENRVDRRRGAVAVETAVVLIWMLMFVFGVFEYGRLVMDWNLLNNAAREGCRYALVNNTSPTLSTQVQSVVTNYMAGETSSYSNFTVVVSGTQNGKAAPVNNLGPGDMITVKVSGTYNFLNIIPLVSMPATLTVSSSVTMVCEGGT